MDGGEQSSDNEREHGNGLSAHLEYSSKVEAEDTTTTTTTNKGNASASRGTAADSAVAKKATAGHNRYAEASEFIPRTEQVGGATTNKGNASHGITADSAIAKKYAKASKFIPRTEQVGGVGGSPSSPGAKHTTRRRLHELEEGVVAKESGRIERSPTRGATKLMMKNASGDGQNTNIYSRVREGTNPSHLNQMEFANESGRIDRPTRGATKLMMKNASGDGRSTNIYSRVREGTNPSRTSSDGLEDNSEQSQDLQSEQQPKETKTDASIGEEVPRTTIYLSAADAHTHPATSTSTSETFPQVHISESGNLDGDNHNPEVGSLQPNATVTPNFSNYSDERYPTTDLFHMESDGLTEGIQAFVADEEVLEAQATVVDDEKQDRQERKKTLYFAIGVCLCVVIAIVILIALLVLRPDSGESIFTTLSPNPAPSPIPSASPTQPPTSTFYYEGVQFVIAQGVSSADAIMTMGSPQDLAIRWITEEDALRRRTDHPLFLQRYVMAVWYFALDGDNWIRCSRNFVGCTDNNYLSPVDECDWYNIGCVDGHIRTIELGLAAGHYLKGSIPEEICLLKRMSGLSLSNNNIFGTLPACFSNFQDLNKLNVVNNDLSSPLPAGLFNLPKMVQLVLSANQFDEEFPDISNMTFLFDFRASSNKFSGSIKPGVGILKMLGTFEVDNNHLTGTIPEDFASLPDLESFKVNNNSMHGIFPEQFYNQTSLRQLWISNNSFFGTIPSFVENFGRDQPRQKQLYLNGNELSGVIPSEFGKIVRLEVLNLAQNKFVGTMPESVCAIRGTSFSDLKLLEVDCAEVNCSCCTNCV